MSNCKEIKQLLTVIFQIWIQISQIINKPGNELLRKLFILISKTRLRKKEGELTLSFSEEININYKILILYISTSAEPIFAKIKSLFILAMFVTEIPFGHSASHA